MSLNGMMRTGVSGMNAQANRLSTVSENIANSNTTGYKRADTEFTSLILGNSGGGYSSGAVETDVRYHISKGGETEFTQSGTDLAIKGEGFFVVQDPMNPDKTYLTRAGSFVPDGEGRLVNAAGFILMGTQAGKGAVVEQDLVPVDITAGGMEAVPTTEGYFSGNLPGNSAVGDTVSTSLTTYDKAGNEVVVDLEFEMVDAGDPVADTPQIWNLVITRRDTGAVLNVSANPQVIEFDASTRELLTGGNMTLSLDSADADAETITFDLSGMQALNADFEVDRADFNGSEPANIDGVEIAADGVVYAKYDNGDLRPMYQLKLGAVASPDKLNPLPGNVYETTVDSGDWAFSDPGDGGRGVLQAGALESSNVDIAEELTTMIESQRAYTANSKSFQTGSELMDILVNLKR